MYLIAALVCCFVAVHAWPSNMIGNNMQNQGNNGMYGGGNMNNMGGQQNMGNGQMWGQGMYQNNGNQNTWGQHNWGQGQGQQWGHTGNQQQGGQQNMNNNMLHLLLGNVLANNMRGGQQQQWQQQHQQQQQQQGYPRQQENNMKDMEEIEEMMKEKMMKEIAHLVMYQMELKEKEEAYMNAAKFLCMIVNATFTDAMKRGNESEHKQVVSDEDMATYEKELHEMNDHQKFQWLLNKRAENETIFGEIFFKTAVWNCETGMEYKMAFAKYHEKENEGNCGSGMGDKEMGKGK